MLFFFWIGDKNSNPVNYEDIKDVIKISSYNYKIDYLGGIYGEKINKKEVRVCN